MAKTVNTVSFVNPLDQNALNNALELQKAQRQQEIMQSLLKQSMAPFSDTQIVSGHAVRRSPLEFVAKILGGYLANKNIEKSDANLIDLQQKQAQSALNMFNPVPQQEASQVLDTDTMINPVAEAPVQSAPINNINAPQEQIANILSGKNAPPNKFSWENNQQLPPSINIADNMGNTQQISNQSPWQPINDIRPLPVNNNVGPTSQVPQQMQSVSQNMPMPQQAAPNPFNRMNLSPQEAYLWFSQDPSGYLAFNAKGLEPTNLQREDIYSGITPQQRKNIVLQNANQQVNAAALNNGIAGVYDEGGRITGVNALQGFNTTKKEQIRAQNEANMPYDVFKSALETNKSKTIEANKKQLENQYDFVEVTDANGNMIRVPKGQASGTTTKLSPATEQTYKDYAKHYVETQQTGYTAKQTVPRILNKLELIDQTATGLGTKERNELLNKLATYGVNFKNKNLGNQQLLEAEAFVDAVDAAQTLKPISNTDIDLLLKAAGSINTDKTALRKLAYKAIGDLQQKAYNSDVANENYTKNGGFNKYNEVFVGSQPIDKNAAI